jgi:predicted enzyme involved in methoxymalonyl-ACP biosynthesis
VFSANLTEIYEANKTTHLRAIAKKAGCDVKDIIFFDNDYSNCNSVAKIGTGLSVLRNDFSGLLKSGG